MLANRSFGGAQVSRTFYARGQTGQQLLLGAYSSLMRQVAGGQVKMFPRRELLDLVLVDGQARGIVVRNLITGEIERHAAHAVVLATGGYGRCVLSCPPTAWPATSPPAFRAYKKGAGFANPCFTQIHPTCIPVHGDYQSKLTLMSESLRNDGRVWVPKQAGDTQVAGADPRRGAGLLPGAHLSQLRQPGPPGYLLPGRQAHVRPGQGCRAHRPGRLSGFRRCHQAPGQGRDRSQVRQPLPDV